MVDTDRIGRMKDLGIVERKSDHVAGEKEYSFKPICMHCGAKVEFCWCTSSLEDAERILQSEKSNSVCNTCFCKPEHMSPSLLLQVAELIVEQNKDGTPVDWMTACEILQENWGIDSWDEPVLIDGVEAYPCECPVSFGS